MPPGSSERGGGRTGHYGCGGSLVARQICILHTDASFLTICKVFLEPWTGAAPQTKSQFVRKTPLQWCWHNKLFLQPGAAKWTYSVPSGRGWTRRCSVALSLKLSVWEAQLFLKPRGGRRLRLSLKPLGLLESKLSKREPHNLYWKISFKEGVLAKPS